MEQKTKRTLLVILWWAAAVVLLVGLGLVGYYFYQFSVYNDSQYHFSLKYPRTWNVMQGFQGTAVTFVRPKQTALDLFQPTANVSIVEVPDHIATLSSFSETITKQMTAVFKKHITILEDKDCTFAKRLGHRLIIDAPEPDHLKAFFIWTIKDSIAYIFTFMARTDQLKELSFSADQMISSFEFK